MNVMGANKGPGYAGVMPVVDLDHPPEGVVLLADPDDAHTRLSPQTWVEAARRETPRTLRRPVAQYLNDARDQEDV